MKRRNLFMALIATITLVLAACGMNNGTSEESAETESDKEGMSHSEMNHSSSGEVPEDLEEAENPTYPKGSQAVLQTDHMKGMEGATATVTGAYDTTAYIITYTPTTGGEEVQDHKWVVHEEIEDAGEENFETGDEVVLNAEHMKGMEGATAIIDSARDTTVYMVSYTDTATGDEVEHHKWVTEEELAPAD